MSGFEGSFLGKAGRLDPASVLECGVCWWVYDPQLGDPTWQIPPGTAFTDLPEHWRCPNCDNAGTQFMVLQHRPGSDGEHQRPDTPAALVTIQQRTEELLTAYREIDRRMRSLPVYNDKLDVQVLGLRRWTGGLVGIVSTPWCMNILLLPPEGSRARIEGTVREVDFPSGCYRFVAGHLDQVGAIESCSLFSPMQDFDNPGVAAEVAMHAIDGLFQNASDEPAGTALSRRGFLRGGRESREPYTG